jgi:hypothetical protein
MSVKSKITKRARQILSFRIRRGDSSWPDISLLCQAYGQDEVVGVFEEWAQSKAAGELMLTLHLLDDFVRVADELLKHEDILKPSPKGLRA